MAQSTVGEQLRTARLAKNLDLSQIAEATKIGKFYLEALETNQIERLPGLFFYKAFVRQYAKYLGLDSSLLEQQIHSDHGEAGVSVAELRQVTKPPIDRSDALRAANSIRPDTRFMLAAAGLIAVLMGGSFVYTWLQHPAGSAGVEMAAQKPTVTITQRPASSSPYQNSAQQAASVNGVAVQQVSDNLTPNAAPDSAVTLYLSAIEPTWLSISSDGKTIYSGVLEPQQSKQLAGNSSVIIRVGNAAGLDVKWNGKAVGKLGDPKQVRTIMFTGKEFQILNPPPPPAPTQAPAPVL
jgi:cytoskeleton protein RodZ